MIMLYILGFIWPKDDCVKNNIFPCQIPIFKNRPFNDVFPH